MTERRQKIRGTTAQLDAQLGAAGLLAVDSSKNELRLYNGVLLGGYRIVPPNLLPAPRTLSPITTNSPGDFATVGHTHALTGVVSNEDEINGSGVKFRAGAGLALTSLIKYGDLYTIELPTPGPLSATSINANSGAPGSDGHTHAIDSTIARSATQVIAGNGLTGGGALTANRTLTLGTPATLTASTTNAVTTTSHTHAVTGFILETQSIGTRGILIRDTNNTTSWSKQLQFVDRFELQMPQSLGASSSNYQGSLVIAGDGHTHEIDSTIARSATQVIAGNGLTGGGALTANRTLTLGTPGTITNTSTNAVTSTSHTHALDATSVRTIYSESLVGTASGANSIGIVAMLKPQAAGVNLAYGDIVSANDLRLTDVNNAAGALLLGTQQWRCLGQSISSSGTLFQRV